MVHSLHPSDFGCRCAFHLSLQLTQFTHKFLLPCCTHLNILAPGCSEQKGGWNPDIILTPIQSKMAAIKNTYHIHGPSQGEASNQRAKITFIDCLSGLASFHLERFCPKWLWHHYPKQSTHRGIRMDETSSKAKIFFLHGKLRAAPRHICETSFQTQVPIKIKRVR